MKNPFSRFSNLITGALFVCLFLLMACSFGGLSGGDGSTASPGGGSVPVIDGYTATDGLEGYASVTNDSGSAYNLYAGKTAAEIEVSSLSELQTALSGTGPKIIKISGTIDNTGSPSISLDVPSNTTIYGNPDNVGHLKNIELKLSGGNYALRNLILSEFVAVQQKDGSGNVLAAAGNGSALLIIDGGRHVWIDHCEFYASLNPVNLYDIDGDMIIDQDDASAYFGGLVLMKNGGSFVTLSNNYFHDHWDALSIGEVGVDDRDNNRVTICNNYFKDIYKGIPTQCYGRLHFYNNLVKGTFPTLFGGAVRMNSIVNLRQGSNALIEYNYLEGYKNSIGYFYTTSLTTTGYWNLSGNSYSDVDNTMTMSSGDLTVSYSYTLADTGLLSTTIPSSTGTGILTAAELP